MCNTRHPKQGTQHQQIVIKQEYNQRLRESSHQSNIWENTIGLSLSVFPGQSTSSGQCSPLGRKDNKVYDQEADEQLVITGRAHSMSGSRVRKCFDDHSQCKAHANPWTTLFICVSTQKLMAPQHFSNKGLVKASGG